jgi:multiple sugar transport system ATP-binding protein
MSMGDKVGVLNKGQVAQVGTPQQIYNSPRDTFVAAFVGSPAMNLLKGELRDGALTVMSGALAVPLSGPVAERVAGVSGPVTAGIRAEDVQVGPEGTNEARIHHVENHGVELILTLRVDRQLFKATTPATMRLAVEDTVRFAWAPDKVHLFDEKGISYTHR